MGLDDSSRSFVARRSDPGGRDNKAYGVAIGTNNNGGCCCCCSASPPALSPPAGLVATHSRLRRSGWTPIERKVGMVGDTTKKQECGLYGARFGSSRGYLGSTKNALLPFVVSPRSNS
jgi:hypothetical protein